jgi:hypothetical protein
MSRQRRGKGLRAWLGIGLLGLVVSGCTPRELVGSKPFTPDMKEQEHAAIGHAVACTRQLMPVLDDGLSSAAVIATALVQACAREFAGVTAIRGQTLTPYARQLFERDVQQTYWEMEIQDVLRYRTWKRGQAREGAPVVY